MIKEYFKRRKLNKMKSEIRSEHFDLLTDDKDYYEIEKLLDWQEDYDWVEWDRFLTNWFKCSLCGDYEEGQCICYAR